MNTDEKYDGILKVELEKRLKRQPTASEIVNADNDADLVNETLWQLIADLDTRLKTLEDNRK